MGQGARLAREWHSNVRSGTPRNSSSYACAARALRGRPLGRPLPLALSARGGAAAARRRSRQHDARGRPRLAPGVASYSVVVSFGCRGALASRRWWSGRASTGPPSSSTSTILVFEPDAERSSLSLPISTRATGGVPGAVSAAAPDAGGL